MPISVKVSTITNINPWGLLATNKKQQARVLVWKEYIPEWNVFAPYPKTSIDLSQIHYFPKHLLTVGNVLGITLKTLFKVQLLGWRLRLDNKTN